MEATSLREAPSRESMRNVGHLAGGVGWPGIIVACVGYSGFALVAYAFIAGMVGFLAAFLGFLLFSYVLFLPLHEAAHGNISGTNKKTNVVDETVGGLAGFLIVAPLTVFRALHLAHHQNTNVFGRDPDLWVSGQSLPTIAFKCLTIWPYYVFYFLKSDQFTLKTKLRGVVEITLVFTVAYFLPGDLGPCWLLAGIVGTSVDAFVLDWIPHHPHIESSPFKNTRNFRGRLLFLLMQGHSLHQIHHLNPKVPIHRYPKAAKEMGDEFLFGKS